MKFGIAKPEQPRKTLNTKTNSGNFIFKFIGLFKIILGGIFLFGIIISAIIHFYENPIATSLAIIILTFLIFSFWLPALIQFFKEIFSTKSESRDIKLQMANYYLKEAQYIPASEIADEYLKINNKDIDFLFVKLKIEEASGSDESIKNYKNKILAINPKAFKKFDK